MFAAPALWAQTVNVTPLASLHASPPVEDERIGSNVAASGRFVAAGSNMTRTAKVFDSVSGKQVRNFASPSTETADLFGYSCAMSGDYVVVGAPNATGLAGGSKTGKAYVFSLKSGKLLYELFPSGTSAIDGGRFGYSVAASGRFIVVGAPYDNTIGTAVGAVYLFDTKTGQRVRKVFSTNSSNNQNIGLNVAIGGNWIAASSGYLAPYPVEDSPSSKVGKVYLWNAMTGVSSTPLLDDDMVQDDYFGRSICIVDGIVAVGEPFQKVGAVTVGVVHLYEAATGKHLRTLTPSNLNVSGRFGWDVASDGNHLAVSDPIDNRFRIFNISNGAEMANFTHGVADSRAGYSLAMEGDLLVAGTPFDDYAQINAGSIQVFDCSLVKEGDGRWGAAVAASTERTVTGSPNYQLGNQSFAGSASAYRANFGSYLPLAFPGGALTGDHFGAAVGMDANYTAIGAPGRDRNTSQNAGLAYIFGSQAGGYVQTLAPDKVQANAQFGAALDVNDGRVIVGAPGANGSKGAAYLYNPYSTGLLHKFETPTGMAGDRLGQSVSVARSASRGGANLAVIGIPQDNNAKGTDAGRVDVYNLNNGKFIKSLMSDKVDGGARFGTAVVVREKILAIGAPKANHGGANTGSVFVYDAKSLALRYVLTGGASANTNGGFGSAIATDGRLIAVGAPNDDEIRPGAGAVYLFRVTDGLLLRKFAVNLGNDGAHLGMSLAMHQGKIIVGAPDHDRIIHLGPGLEIPVVDSGATVEFDVRAMLRDSNLFGGEPKLISSTITEAKVQAPALRGYTVEYSSNDKDWFFAGAFEGTGQQQTIKIPYGGVATYYRIRGL